MRAASRALLTYCALATILVVPPVMAQTDNAAAASAVVPAADVDRAVSEIKSSWQNFIQCARTKVCAAYFDSFGVAITFSDGSIVPFTRAQRLTATEHACIANARAALARGDRGLAVQWVMAAKLNVPAVRNWLGDHPDAVVEALRTYHF